MHGARFVVSEEKLLSDGTLVEAREASDEDLLVVHTRRYLNELKVRGLGAAGGGGGPQSPGAPLLPLCGGRGACASAVPIRSQGRGCSLEGLHSCPCAGGGGACASAVPTGSRGP